MRAPPHVELAARAQMRTLRRRVERSFTRPSKRGARTYTCNIDLSRQLWNKIRLLMFTYCLFIFPHAFLGFGPVPQDLRTFNDTFVLPRATLFIPSNRDSAMPDVDEEMRTQTVTQVMVDWHGNYELVSSTTLAPILPASIPQDAFPDPTPALVGARRRRAPDKDALSLTTQVKSPVDTPLPSYGTLYGLFQLVFKDSVREGEVRGLYPIADSPKTEWEYEALGDESF